MVAGEGVEPSRTESESAVLPLDDPATVEVLYQADIFLSIKKVKISILKRKDLFIITILYKLFLINPSCVL
jgi:hypothetical protein